MVHCCVLGLVCADILRKYLGCLSEPRNKQKEAQALHRIRLFQLMLVTVLHVCW